MSRLIGSSKIETTTEETTELVTYRGKDNDYTNPSTLHNMSFATETACTVVVNDGEEVFIPAGATLELSDIAVKSFIINGSGVKYMWLATI